MANVIFLPDLFLELMLWYFRSFEGFSGSLILNNKSPNKYLHLFHVS